MPAAFSQTCHALSQDRPLKRSMALLVAALLLGWSAWLAFGRVTVYQSASSARVEVGIAAHPVASVVGGRVVETHLAIGREVTTGEALVVLDAEPERRAREEAQVRRQAYAARLAALLGEISAEEEAGHVASAARDAARAESRAQISQSEAKAEVARRQEKISANLRTNRATSELEYRRDLAEAEATQAAVLSVRAAHTKLDHDRALQEKDRLVRLAKLRREAADLEGAAAIETAAIARLDYAISQRCIRAPIGGTLGEVTELRVGAVVSAAEKLGTIVPRDPPRAVAFFPAGSVGRVRPGQPAQLRLDGYPWTQFGTVAATVSEVGNEPSNGLIRVELALQPDSTSTIPLAHGLPGAVEVEVERIAPAMLILRAAGQCLAPRKEPPIPTKSAAAPGAAAKGSEP